MNCPICAGKKVIQNPQGSLYQLCPYCEGTGADPGQEIGYFTYKFQVSLTALQLLPNQRIAMNGMADFRVKLLMQKSTSSNFRVKLYTSEGNALSGLGPGQGGSATATDRIPANCQLGDAALPFLMVPHPLIPKNGYIGLDLEDTSNATNAIEICIGGAFVRPTPIG